MSKLFNTVNGLTFQKEILTDGHSPLLFVGANYKLYIVKNGRGHNPSYPIINEFLANFLLRQWQITTPPAVFFDVPIDVLNFDELSKYHKSIYYDTLCFGSELIENAIDMNDFLIGNKKHQYNDFENPLDVLHIALFDLWVENDDRKPTNYNLIYVQETGKFKIIPIDHAFIFSTLKYIDLDPNSFYPSDNEYILLSDLGLLIKKHYKKNDTFVQLERDYFYFCIAECEKYFNTFTEEIRNIYDFSDENIFSLKHFLFNKERNEKVFDEYLYRISQ